MPASTSPLEVLKRAANLKPTCREVELNNGEIFEFWCTPLTMAERERANKEAASDDINAFALRLLINKATDANGTRLFNPGHLADLKNLCRDEDVQKLLLAVLQQPEDDRLDHKSAD